MRKMSDYEKSEGTTFWVHSRRVVVLRSFFALIVSVHHCTLYAPADIGTAELVMTGVTSVAITCYTGDSSWHYFDNSIRRHIGDDKTCHSDDNNVCHTGGNNRYQSTWWQYQISLRSQC